MTDNTNFCVGFVGKKVYCYGSALQKCLWGEKDCERDSDCSKKYSSNSPKFANRHLYDCPLSTFDSWIAYACECDNGTLIFDLCIFNLTVIS